MSLLEKIVRSYDSMRHNFETKLEYVRREDLGRHIVEVKVYEYNKRTNQNKYLHSVNVVALRSYE